MRVPSTDDPSLALAVLSLPWTDINHVFIVDSKRQSIPRPEFCEEKVPQDISVVTLEIEMRLLGEGKKQFPNFLCLAIEGKDYGERVPTLKRWNWLFRVFLSFHF